MFLSHPCLSVLSKTVLQFPSFLGLHFFNAKVQILASCGHAHALENFLSLTKSSHHLFVAFCPHPFCGFLGVFAQ